MSRLALGTAVLAVAVSAPLRAQTVSHDSVAAFAEALRDATERYRDRAAAVADGFRPVGPDFPSMGVHWINPGLLVAGGVDPRRPPILEYATVGGRPTLVGVAFAQLVDSLGPAGRFPVDHTAWHEHSGSVDEESFLAGHTDSTAGPGARSPGPRLAVLHAWIWLENPAGLFATDNWALPYARLGLRAPTRETEPSAATLAVALAADGERFLGAWFRARFHPARDAAVAADSVLAQGARRVRGLLTGVERSDDDALRSGLEQAWRRIVEEAGEVCPPCRLGELERR